MSLKDPIHLDLEFLSARFIKGRITDDQGEPIVGGAKLDRCVCAFMNGTVRGKSTKGRRFGRWKPLRIDRQLNQPDDVPAAVKIRETDADGRFEFSGLPPECVFRFAIKHRNYANMDVYAATTLGKPPNRQGEPPVLTGDLQLTFQAVQDVPIRVVFSDTGDSAAGVFVSAGSLAGSDWKTADEKGDVILAALPTRPSMCNMLPAMGTPYLVTNI